MDLGTGSGILPVLLLSMAPAATASAVELSPEACKLAHTNFQCNGLSDRARLIPGDLRQYRALIPAGAFDLSVSNPPYLKSEPATTPPSVSRMPGATAPAPWRIYAPPPVGPPLGRTVLRGLSPGTAVQSIRGPEKRGL